MNSSVSHNRLLNAYQKVRQNLLTSRQSSGQWEGELASSPLSTATAICALVIAEQYGSMESHGRHADNLYDSDQVFQGDLSELIMESLKWLAKHQNTDGGWGDTDRSKSNIATTMLVTAAFRLTAIPDGNGNILERAEDYIEAEGGIAGLKRRFGKDKTFAAPILACCALAGIVPWTQVPALPFELACVPQSLYRLVRMPVVSYAIPALVAIGQVRYHFAPPANPITRSLRKMSLEKSLDVVDKMQPESGGFLEATPLTSFVVMSFAGIGLPEHPIVRRGVEFLLSSVRPDGSWPIDSNLAIWNTTLSMSALLREEADSVESSEAPFQHFEQAEVEKNIDCIHWILDSQQIEQHKFTGAQPGGWAWTDLSGGVPDVDDTSGVLLTLAAWRKHIPQPTQARVLHAAKTGLRWLLDIQNRNGGWPTFCKGWGKLPFDRSGTDLTAHAMRAIYTWNEILHSPTNGTITSGLQQEIETAIAQGFKYLEKQQREDGSWLPLWFGNQHNPGDENPVFGTSRVLMMFTELGCSDGPVASKAAKWLASVQHACGGWGSVSGLNGKKNPDNRDSSDFPLCSVEETALALSALQAIPEKTEEMIKSIELGLSWLVEAIEAGHHNEPSPIGLYFAKLWYHERIYPLAFSVSALGDAVRGKELLQKKQLAHS